MERPAERLLAALWIPLVSREIDSTNMRIIVSGGTGLIGSALAARLVDSGYEVIALSRSERTSAPKGVRVVGWDARSAAGWGDLADGAYALVNLAAETISGLWSRDKKQRIRDSRLNAARAITDAVQQAKVKSQVVVQSSGVGYYGARGDELLAEDLPAGDDFLARLSTEWEASTAAVEDFGVRRAILRTGLVLSDSAPAFALMALPFKLFVGGQIGNGRQWISWIHLRDEVAAIQHLIENQDASGPFNMVAPHPVRSGEFSKLIGDALKRPS